MSVGVLEIMGRDRADRAILGLDRPTREALKIYCERRWPVGRRKAIEREWGLSPDQARGVMDGTPSTSTIDTVWKRGGWAVVLPILGAVIGHGVGEFFAEEAERAREEAELAQREADALAQAEHIAQRSFAPRMAGAGADLVAGLDAVGARLAAVHGRGQAPSVGGRKAGRS